MTVPFYLGREKTFPIFGTKNDSSYLGECGRMISAPTKNACFCEDLLNLLLVLGDHGWMILSHLCRGGYHPPEPKSIIVPVADPLLLPPLCRRGMRSKDPYRSRSPRDSSEDTRCCCPGRESQPAIASWSRAAHAPRSASQRQRFAASRLPSR